MATSTPDTSRPVRSTGKPPALPSFHVAPPRKFGIELPALEFDRLERYVAFYNECTGGGEDAPAVAAAIVQHFIARDRNFKRWDDRQAARDPAAEVNRG